MLVWNGNYRSKGWGDDIFKIKVKNLKREKISVKYKIEEEKYRYNTDTFKDT